MVGSLGRRCLLALSSRWSVEPFGHFRLFRPSLPQTFLPFSHGTLRTNTDSQDRDSTPDNAQSYLFPKYFGGKFGGVSVPRVSSDVFVVTGSEVGHFSGLEIEGCRKDFSWKVWWTRDFVVTLQTILDVL